MDPDTCLAEIRELVAQSLTEDDDTRLAEHVQALDEWLSRGGFLPAPWRPEASTPAS